MRGEDPGLFSSEEIKSPFKNPDVANALPSSSESVAKISWQLKAS